MGRYTAAKKIASEDVFVGDSIVQIHNSACCQGQDIFFLNGFD
jgi:hypothetical protein